MSLDFTQSKTSTYLTSIPDVAVARRSIDGIEAVGETEYRNEDFPKWWGYFMDNDDLHSAMLMKSTWNVGKGWTADNPTTILLDNIIGWGKDTFDDLLFNMDIIRNVGGDSYAHIIRNDKTGSLINLKPLDPELMVHIVGDDGMLIRYEQVSKVKNKAKKKFPIEEIFHLCNFRLGSQIHGISRIEAMEDTILANKESFVDTKKLMHHQVRPFFIWHIKSDKPSKITSIIDTITKSRKDGEDSFIPDDDNAIRAEKIELNISNAVLEWRTDIRNKFYRGLGLPLIIFGSGGSTESGGKMEIFAHGQVWKKEQSYIEKQIWNQLGIRIKLNKPDELLDNLQGDEAKDAGQGLEAQPSDITAGSGA